MTVRSLVVGALSVTACLAISGAFSDASAEMKKKGGGVGICVSKPRLSATCSCKPFAPRKASAAVAWRGSAKAIPRRNKLLAREPFRCIAPQRVAVLGAEESEMADFCRPGIGGADVDAFRRRAGEA